MLWPINGNHQAFCFNAHQQCCQVIPVATGITNIPPNPTHAVVIQQGYWSQCERPPWSLQVTYDVDNQLFVRDSICDVRNCKARLRCRFIQLAMQFSHTHPPLSRTQARLRNSSIPWLGLVFIVPSVILLGGREPKPNYEGSDFTVGGFRGVRDIKAVMDNL